MKQDRIRKRTKYITISAMLSALGVVLLAIGATVDVLDVTAAVFASLLCIYAVIEIGGAYPWLIWLSTSVLGLLLLPIKTPALFYALFAGFYPIVKEKLEKQKPPLALLCKLGVFHLSLAGIVAVFLLFFPADALLENTTWLPFVLYGMSLVVFFLYDVALTRLISFYLIRLRHRFRIR